MDIIDFEGKPTPGLMTYTVSTAETLRLALADVLARVRNQAMRPALHFEGHGWEGGVASASGEEVPWATLKDWITPINVELRLGLLMALASCEGATLTKALRLEDRAPVWGIIGATQALTVAQILRDYGRFYAAMFRGESMTRMLEALRRDAPASLYYSMSAEQFFLAVWRNYREEQCSGAALSQRIASLRAVGRGEFDRLSDTEITELLVAQERPNFERCRAIYFMHDLYPENAELYCPQYKDIPQISASR
jgi:hypothetical protein